MGNLETVTNIKFSHNLILVSMVEMLFNKIVLPNSLISFFQLREITIHFLLLSEKQIIIINIIVTFQILAQLIT